jgi:transposase
MEIIRGKSRRRWSAEEKRRLVAETFVPGTTVHAVARRHEINSSMLFTWRKLLRRELGFAVTRSDAAGFAPVAIAGTRVSEPMPAASASVWPMIEIELPGGARVRITGAAEPALVTALLTTLAQR